MSFKCMLTWEGCVGTEEGTKKTISALSLFCLIFIAKGNISLMFLMLIIHPLQNKAT